MRTSDAHGSMSRSWRPVGSDGLSFREEMMNDINREHLRRLSARGNGKSEHLGLEWVYDWNLNLRHGFLSFIIVNAG